MTQLSVHAPAKLNLGLEVVGRRADGYHEIVTILQAVTRFDVLIATPGPDIRVDAPDLSIKPSQNLVVAAAQTLQRHSGTDQGIAISLAKTIPVAAGLGGASSDAAATLLAADQIWDTRLPATTLAEVAASIGSDVPFFLRGGTTLATGRGEQLASLPYPQSRWFVVVAPHLRIPQKTATLYGALTDGDFGTGDRVRRQAQRLQDGEPLDPGLLVNTFLRPLYALRPELQTLAGTMRKAGAPFVALSGAGPSHYTALEREADALRLVEALRSLLADQARVFACEPLAGPPRIFVGDTTTSAAPQPDQAPPR